MRITAAKDCFAEIDRLALGRKTMTTLQNIWNDRDISVGTNIQLVCAVIFPVMTYAAKTWTTTKRDRLRMQAFEKRRWRLVLRIPWIARRSNDSIHQTLDHQM